MSGTVCAKSSHTFSSDLTCSTALYRADSPYMASDEGVKQNKV